MDFHYRSDDDEDPIFDHDDDDDEPFAYGNRFGRRNGRGYNLRDSYFGKIQLSVTEEENKSVDLTSEDEEHLFNKISLYLKKPFAIPGILTLQKLAFIPPTVSADRLKDIAKIICRNVFNPLSVTEDYISEYVDFCKGFAYLKATTNEGVRITFEQILISAFLDELPKKFYYTQRLREMLVNRDIPPGKKIKWLAKQIEEQQKVFKIRTHKSISFLDKLFQLFPEIVYRVIEFLLNSFNDDDDGLQYLYALLRTVRYRVESNDEHVLTDIYQMKFTHWERNQHNPFRRLAGHRPLPVQRESLTPLFGRIITLSNFNDRLTGDMRDVIMYQIIDGNPVKDNYPQDYMKYCIKDCLHFDKFNLEDDFKIDNEDEYDCNIYTLRSKNFVSYGTMLLWKGLRVKILTKKSGKPPVRGRKFGFGRGRRY